MVAEGALLSGRYRLEERIASGAMGTVYGAIDERLHRKVALKLLKADLAEDPRFLERFRREARSAAALSHQNVAGVFDYGEDDDCSYIVMELAGGSDLARVIREDGALPAARAARIGGQIAAALAHAHSLGVVHRDIKPANVLVDSGDNIKVTDFGIARATGDSTLTATGSVLGTAHYLSPEQASGGEVGPPSDIYSLGIVLYEMLTGAVPFTGDSAISIAMRHVSEEVPIPSTLRPDLPPHLDDVVRRATRKDPAERYPDASEMSAALLGDEGAQATDRLAAPVAVGAATLVEEGGPTGVMSSGSSTGYGLMTDGLKRTAFLVLGGLAAVALLLALYRGATGGEDDAPVRRAAQTEESPASDEAPAATFRIPDDLYGREAEPFIQDAESADIEVDPIFVPSGELDPGLIIDVSPEEGSILQPGDTITLEVSTLPGGEEEDHKEEEEEAKEEAEKAKEEAEKAKGKDKKDKD